MNLIENELKILNDYLKMNLSDENKISGDVLDFIFSKSKRLRPMLIFLFAKALDLKISDNIYNLAACSELIHNSTLIHDDIIDDAQLRRGKVSLNKKLGNNLSVLAGDFLLSSAMLHLAKCNNIKCFEIFSYSLQHMCKGEINQHFTLNEIPTFDEYIEKSKNKTAELFNASICALFEMKNLSNIQEASNFALNFGIAFQIKDDLVNVLKTDSSKPQLSDIYNGNYSAPVIFLQENISNVDNLSKEEIIELVNNNEIISKTVDLIKQYANKAIASLEFIKDNQYKQELISLCENLYKVV